MVLAVIPARFASSRFPGKPLVEIHGKSMIQRVYEQVLQASSVDSAIVATDDHRIFDHICGFGGKAMMTLDSHQSGTDRCAEVAKKFQKAKIILNIQGDEPFVQPEQIDLLAATLSKAPRFQIATLVKKITDPQMLFNPNVVKAVFSEQQGGIYFSRHPIPYSRGNEPAEWLDKTDFYKHIGLYGFTRKALLSIAKLPASPLERAESLEQLRWIENGFKIAIGITELETIGIDAPEDLAKVAHLFS